MTFLALLAGCSLDDSPTYADVSPILERKCNGCHRPGAIAPFALTSFEDVSAVSELVKDSVESGRMPPWPADPTCNDYINDFDLSEEEKRTLLAWLDAGSPEGGQNDGPSGPSEPEFVYIPDQVFPLPEPYTPVATDDYRCQLIDPGLDTRKYVTGFVAQPDNAEIAHHVIVFKIDAANREAFEDMDADHDGPGWPCYGGPMAPGANLFDGDLSEMSLGELLALFESGEGIGALGGFGWLGSWAPGSPGALNPDGTGIPMEPGDVMVVQMHYNTASGNIDPDQTAIGLSFADQVERPAMVVPYTNVAWVTELEVLGEPMTIPAGSPDTHHSDITDGDGILMGYVRDTLGIEDDSDLMIHQVAHHMHTLGKTGRQTVVHADGSETCMVDIADWDFDWQTGYRFVEPIRFAPDDEIELACSWDNSPSNQPVIDGEIAEPVDVAWGEGTRDEMCLGILYVTEP